jgi:hypothetical protein
MGPRIDDPTVSDRQEEMDGAPEFAVARSKIFLPQMDG